MASAGNRDRDRDHGDRGGPGHHDNDKGRGGKDHGKGHGGKDFHHHKDRDRIPDHIQGRVNKNRLAIAGSKGYTDGDATGSEAMTYGRKPPTCSPYVTTWNCIPPY